MRKEACQACQGTGMMADDEGWQYQCSVCHGSGHFEEDRDARIMEVDENNRLLD